MTPDPASARLRPRLGDSGYLAQEAALVAGALVLMIMLVVYAGRTSAMSGHVSSAAAEAARAASLAASPAGATAAARQSADANLDRDNVNCDSFRVDVNTVHLAPGGSVGVTVHCWVSLSQLAPIAPGGQRHFQSQATETVDVYRGGTPG
jgi:Flp pilus assembly protein TadG